MKEMKWRQSGRNDLEIVVFVLYHQSMESLQELRLIGCQRLLNVQAVDDDEGLELKVVYTLLSVR